MNDHFILENGQPVKVDHLTWARWFVKNDRSIAQSKKGDVSVSTVFLGLNHQFGEGPP